MSSSNYGGSSALAQQIVSGAPADVFAAASEATMQTVVDEGLAADPVVFATNTLELVVPAGQPRRRHGSRRPRAARARDRAVRPGRSVRRGRRERCSPRPGSTAAPDTLEEDVKAVVTKVLLGEADAGLVYVTDVRAAGAEVEGIADRRGRRRGEPVSGGADRGRAEPATWPQAWIDLLTGPDGQAALAEAGFGAP